MPRITIYEFFPIKDKVEETKDTQPSALSVLFRREIPMYNKLNAVAKLFRQRSK
jgi:hypothetical protein